MGSRRYRVAGSTGGLSVIREDGGACAPGTGQMGIWQHVAKAGANTQRNTLQLAAAAFEGPSAPTGVDCLIV
jgi:hypothetical protein